MAAGMAVLTTSLSAKALTFNFSFANTAGSPNTGGTVTGTVTGLTEGVNNLTQPGITANVLSGVNVSPFTASSGGTGTGSITVASGQITAYSFSLVSGNYVLNFNKGGGAFSRLSDFSAYDYYVGNGNVFTSASPASVPGPLPLLGASAAFAWSRRLRRRSLRSTVATDAIAVG